MNCKVLRIFFWGFVSLCIAACQIEELKPAPIEVHYSIPQIPPGDAPQHMRYAVKWIGASQSQVTNDGPVAQGADVTTVHINLPRTEVLKDVLPIETTFYSFSYMPDAEIRRPRIILYDDVNQNQQYDHNQDVIIALDGFDLDFFESIFAFVDIDNFLSKLNLDQTLLYYSWTGGNYTALLYGEVLTGWRSTINPLFETEEYDPTTYVEPLLSLNVGHQLLMKTHLECFRDIEEHNYSNVIQVWVDSTLDVEQICSNTNVPCAPFDKTIPPNFEAMAASTEVFDQVCHNMAGQYVSMAINQGTLSCEQCSCTYTFDSTIYHVSAEDGPPVWWPCLGEQPFSL